MRTTETGFRAFYHHFCAVKLNENIAMAVKNFPGADEANCVLTYGYVDPDAGLTLEILACGKKQRNGLFKFFDGAPDIRVFIRRGDVTEDESFCFSNEYVGFARKKYADKIEALHSYDAPDEIEKTREYRAIDRCRNDIYIDDVLVYLTKDGLQPERCWVRITGSGEGYLIGTLLNEPDQQFGWHEGEQITFGIQEAKDGGFVCVADMNGITEEVLEDGEFLEAAVKKFNSERNEDNLIILLKILRNSYVWVPCTAVLSEDDQARLEKLVKGKETDLVGTVFTTQGKMRLVPDILHNGEAFFFPIFSNEKAMGEYGHRFSKVQKHILEAISLARNNDKDLAGIILNAFTEPFVITKPFWDIIEKIEPGF